MKKQVLSFISLACVVFTLNAACCTNGKQKDCCPKGSSETTRTSCQEVPKSCCQQSKKEGTSVEVIYFHGKQRCATCLSIEKLSRELVEGTYAGKVSFSVVDISTEEGKRIAADYKITFSSLFLVSRKDGEEKRTDLSRMAFQYAKENPEKFKKQLSEAIQPQIGE